MGRETEVKRSVLYVIGPSIAYVQLTQGMNCVIDAENGPLLGKWNWSYGGAKTRKYAMRMQKFPGNKSYTHVCMHWMIVGKHDSLVVDHANGNPLDNRRSNLRLCTRRQNQQNIGISSSNKTGVKGVSWDQRKNKFCARIRANGKENYLGEFHDIEDAGAAYRAAALEMHGEFARFE